MTLKKTEQYKVSAPQHISGTVSLPASKSIGNRALIISALAGDTALPDNLSDCDDTAVIVKALADMPETIDIGAAGTAMRFMTAYLAVTEGRHLITGTERMRHRPIGVLVDALRSLGACIDYAGEQGFPPLAIEGRQLKGGRLEIPGNVSSQYISALLMIGPVMTEGLELRLTGDIISRPYINLTLGMMGDFGADARWTSDDCITVSPKPYTPRPYSIENDWSAASYWFETVAMSPDANASLTLTGLYAKSRQGDAAVKDIFARLGVETEYHSQTSGPSSLTLTKTCRIPERFDYDFTDCPDLAQTVVVCCAMMGVHFHFRGLQSLKIKETDRIEALKKELRKLGFVVSDINGRELYWEGERCEAERQPVIDTYEDHRMAMAFAPCCLLTDSLRINRPMVVTKSYPRFWENVFITQPSSDLCCG